MINHIMEIIIVMVDFSNNQIIIDLTDTTMVTINNLYSHLTMDIEIINKDSKVLLPQGNTIITETLQDSKKIGIEFNIQTNKNRFIRNRHRGKEGGYPYEDGGYPRYYPSQ